MGNFIVSLAMCLPISGMLWLLYVALEPYVRGRWPGRIIGWSHLLAGDWRDPLVWRHVLVGALSGMQYLASMLTAQAPNSLLFSSMLMFLLLLTIVTRRERVGAAVPGALLVALFFGNGNVVLDALVGLSATAVTLFVMLRFGMLALVFMEFFLPFFTFYPVASDFSAWYAGPSAFAAALGVALVLYGFKTSLAGRPLFRGSLVNG